MKVGKKVSTIFLFIILVVLLVVWQINRNDHPSMEDLTKITAENTFKQKDKEYIVYFWQATCTYCKEIEKDVLVYSASNPIYVVDMQNEKNVEKWYDWEEHHKKYDKVIGKVESDKEILKDGINIEDFQQNKMVSWSIEINDNKEIIATHNTAYANEKPSNASELEITGTPTMLKVKDGLLVDYVVGVEESVKMLEK
ncbi:MAG TPA: hypothetical protein VNR61_07445 [Niallia sp.]|nr:hypothetical protein [Niallia sp.]